MKKLVIIDGNAIIHRAYHALPKTMTTRKGEPTNAVYGFITTLIKVLEDLKPDYIAASFDLAGPTFRHQTFKEYKATRIKADQELYDQIPRVKEIVEVMNIPIYEKQGYEADDCIGTIVEKIRNSNIEIRNKSEIRNSKKTMEQLNNETMIYIVSGDKDIYQLIDGKVKVYSLRKGLSQTQIVDHETIKKEYNLDPCDFIDLKALAGDASDNIPGVPGIGSKTATQLLQDFDTLEKLYVAIGKSASNCHPELDSESKKNEIPDHPSRLRLAEAEVRNDKLAKIKPRILELLIKYKDQAFLSQKLATIHRDVPIKFSLEDAKWGEYDRNKLRILFEELGFQSLLRRFDDKNNDEAGMTNDEKMTKSEKNLKPEMEKEDQQLKLL